MSRNAICGSSEKEWRSGLLLALRDVIVCAAAAAAASMAPVRVDMVRVIELLELVERCDRSLSVEDVRSSVLDGETRPFGLTRSGSFA